VKAAREAWFAAQPDLDADKLVFLDETAAATNMDASRAAFTSARSCSVAYSAPFYG
jgi:hypothetical protein